MGHIEQLRQPGDFVTAEVAGAPIMVTVDREGRLRAFHNVRSWPACRAKLITGHVFVFWLLNQAFLVALQLIATSEPQPALHVFCG